MMTAGSLQGTTIGSYVVRHEIGNGGMGSVYLAEHTMLGRRAALKVLRRELSANQEMVTRFFNEARAASAIKSPGIVEIYDFGYHVDGSAYLVMELLEGESLSARLRRFRCLPVPQALHIARQIASALAPAHRAGIVHRDLKPDNIYLVPDAETASGERVKLLDFGIAKLSSDGLGQGMHLTSTKTVMGSPQYMSPEQCRGSGVVDARADLYSLGCILYELIGGRPPFVAEGFGELMGAHLHVAPPPLSTFAPAVPPEVDALAQRLLAKQPAQRPQSAEELAAALSELGSNQRAFAPTMHLPVPGYGSAAGAPPSFGTGPGTGHGTGPGYGLAPGTGHGTGPGTGRGTGPALAPQGLTPPYGARAPGQTGPGYQAPGGAGPVNATTLSHGSGAAMSGPQARPSKSKAVAVAAGGLVVVAAVIAGVVLGRGGKVAAPAETVAAASAQGAVPSTGPSSAEPASALTPAPASPPLADQPPLRPASAEATPEAVKEPAPEPTKEAAPEAAKEAAPEATTEAAKEAAKEASPASAASKTGRHASRRAPKQPEVVVAPAVVPAPVELPEKLSQHAFEAGLVAVESRVRSCANSSGAKGFVYTLIEVTPAGKVKTATVTSSPDPRLSVCVSSNVVHARFAETQTGGKLRKIFNLQ
ncbi:MAG: protein kinase [Myxococcales bacterium]|nr:protein kinase [Myxococcales bacterium]